MKPNIEADAREGILLTQLGLQTFMAHQAGQISDEMRQGLLTVFQRCHTGVAIRMGVFGRIHQRQYKKRRKLHKASKHHEIGLSVVALSLIVIWLWLR